MKVGALGFIEVRGLVAGVEAADAMLKSANVRLVRQHQVAPGLITLVVEGDLAACRAAVDAGIAAAQKIGEVVSRLEIGRPDEDTECMVLKLVARSKAASKPISAPLGDPRVTPPTLTAEQAVASEPEPKTSISQTFSQEETDPPEGRAIKAILAFIAATTRGRSWAEIAKRFPDYDGQKRTLDDMVKKSELRKVGNRYTSNAKSSE